MDLFSLNKMAGPLIKIFWITVGWTLVALFKFLGGYITILDPKFQCASAELDIMLYLKSTLIAGLGVGLIGGTVVVFVWEKWLRTKSYGWVLNSIFWSYTLVYLIVALISGLFFQSSLSNQSVFDPELWQSVLTHILNIATWRISCFGCLS